MDALDSDLTDRTATCQEPRHTTPTPSLGDSAGSHVAMNTERFSDLVRALPEDFWQIVRRNGWTQPTAGLCEGFVQASLVVVPATDAFDFLRFCGRNSQACPVLEVADPGKFEPTLMAQGADLRSDLPSYNVYRGGELEGAVPDVVDLWDEDLVAFLFGCSFSFDYLLQRAGIPVRHIEQNVNAPVFQTNRDCVPAGRFGGPLTVSMRPVPADRVAEAVLLTAAHPELHGAPVHVGAPDALGIADLDQPDWGEPVAIEAGDVPMFWACGVTPQSVAARAQLPLMLAQTPGHMFITNQRLEPEGRTQ